MFSLSLPLVKLKRFVALGCAVLLVACQPEGAPFNGYVEGEYLYLAATSAGILAELSVVRGQQVAAGDSLFALDMTAIEASHSAALAEVAQAQAQWNNLLKGRRPDEIEVIVQQQQQAKIAQDIAQKEYDRVGKLIGAKSVSQADFDAAKSTYETTQAKVAELGAQLRTATLGAREDEILAAKAVMDIARQKVVQTEKQLREAAPKAPSGGIIADTFYNVGEYIGLGAPVVSLLPPAKVKVRFFAPQAKLAQLPLGQKVSVQCDGCPHAVAARVSFIGTQAEYTPPVIYSIGSRDKLVFMVEVTPDVYDPLLKPGLPVDITPVAP